MPVTKKKNNFNNDKRNVGLRIYFSICHVHKYAGVRSHS